MLKLSEIEEKYVYECQNCPNCKILEIIKIVSKENVKNVKIVKKKCQRLLKSPKL